MKRIEFVKFKHTPGPHTRKHLNQQILHHTQSNVLLIALIQRKTFHLYLSICCSGWQWLLLLLLLFKLSVKEQTIFGE